MSMYILTEGGMSFKTFLKENYAIALDSCHLNVKQGIEHDIDSTYGDITHS